jgi:hypothetical protein
MKKNFLLALSGVVCVAAISLSSCSKISNLLKKDLDMQTTTVDFVIPPTPASGDVLSGSQTTFYNVDSFIKASTANQLGVANITSAKIKAVRITINNASAALNFANFETFSGAVHSDANTTDFIVRIPSNPDTYAAVLDLPVDSTVELKSYLNATRFTYTLSGKLRRAVTDSVRCTASFTYSVKVQG